MNNKHIQRLNDHLLKAINMGAFPGCTFGVVCGNTTYVNYLGNRELYPEVIPNTLDTIYDMASLTKVVSTTTLALQAMEKGLFRLYDPVSKFINEFKFDDVRISHLMTHTSGLPEGITGPKDTLKKEDVWAKIFAIDKLNYQPGTKIVYSDINYILLGRILEIVNEESLDKLALDLFTSLDMFDTTYLPKDKKRAAATEYRNDATLTGYVKGTVHDETCHALGGVAGHAGLFSTAPDMVKFIKMILNDGMYEERRILSKTTIDELFKVRAIEKDGVLTLPFKARTLGYQGKDCGSSAGDLVSENTIIHTGFTGTNIFIDRDNKIGFILLSNRVHPTRANVLNMHYRATCANIILADIEMWRS